MKRWSALALFLLAPMALAVTMVADDAAMYRVIAPDGAEVSQHTRWHKAAASATRAAQETGEQHTIEQSLRIRVTPEEPVQDDPATDEPVEDEPVDEEPVTEPGDSEVIAVDQSKLLGYPDPTTLDIYKDYPDEDPKPDGLTQPLSEIADSMEPGEWRHIDSAPYLGDAMWADKAEWDPTRQRVSYLGMHGSPRPVTWVMWDTESGEWHRQRGDEFHPYAGIHSAFGYRSYGRYTQIADGSNVYARFGRLWKQDPETLEWSAWAMHGCFAEISNIESFPNMGEKGSVISFGADQGSASDTRFCAYDIARGEWKTLPRPDVQGRHSLMRYNSVRSEVLLLGGDASYQRAQALQPDGTLVNYPDAPRNTRIRSDQLTVDPVSGDYLLMARQRDDSRPSNTAEFFGLGGDWYKINDWHYAGVTDSDWVFSYHAQPVVTAIPEHGVTMWIESTRDGVYLYKHEVPQ